MKEEKSMSGSGLQPSNLSHCCSSCNNTLVWCISFLDHMTHCDYNVYWILDKTTNRSFIIVSLLSYCGGQLQLAWSIFPHFPYENLAFTLSFLLFTKSLKYNHFCSVSFLSQSYLRLSEFDVNVLYFAI